jgi:2'-5' RNA ligase
MPTNMFTTSSVSDTVRLAYPTPPPSWPAWYSEYRFGAFYLFPPTVVMRQVNALRAQYDPTSAAICDAHVSLTVPVPRALHDDDLHELASRIAGFPAFDVHFGPAHVYPGVPGVVLSIAPVDVLSAMVRALESCDCFLTALPRRHVFSPHMTIAEFVSAERTREIVRELEPLALTGVWRCTEVTYAIPDEAFRFHARWNARLGVEGGNRR